MEDIAVASIKTCQIDNDELTVWENGDLTVEDWQFKFNGNAELDHVHLTRAQVKAARAFFEANPELRTFYQ
jgi:catechol-2,3-dioxygenase